MGEWREVALTVPETLLLVGTGEETVRLIEVAQRKLDVRANLMRRLRLGVPVDIAVEDFADPAPEGVLPYEILDGVRREITQSAALHIEANCILKQYIEHLGIFDDPLCQIWRNHFADSVDLTDQALRRVGEAASHAEAAKDAVALVGILPYRCPLWQEWTLAAEQLMNLATNEATGALHEVREMRQAVSLEFFDAWKILNR